MNESFSAVVSLRKLQQALTTFEIDGAPHRRGSARDLGRLAERAWHRRGAERGATMKGTE